MSGTLPWQVAQCRLTTALLLALALRAARAAGGATAVQAAKGAWSGWKPSAVVRGLEASASTSATSVSQLQWSDTNDEALQIGGGRVSWTPPADVSQVTGYQAAIAYDQQGSYLALLWYYYDYEADDYRQEINVGTNEIAVYEPTTRQSSQEGYPANWLIVYTLIGGALQDTADAAKLPLYDHSTSAPGALPFIIDTSAVVEQSGTEVLVGDALWSFPEKTDLGFVESYDVFLSSSPDAQSEVPIAEVPVGTTQFTLDGSRTCAQGGILGLRAKNRVGRADSATWHALEACPGASLPTTTATVDPDSVNTGTALTFVDTNDAAGQIGGSIITWSPPAGVTWDHYEVYIANDDQGAYMAKLHWQLGDTSGSNMPFGTNEFQIWEPTGRATTNPAYPANWLMVFGSRDGALESASTARKTRLYDHSNLVPNEVAMSSITFTDTDGADYRIAGTLQWTFADDADLGFTTTFAVYLAKDSAGSDQTLMDTVLIGTNQLLLTWGTECWDNNHLLIYASNPNGRAPQAAVKVVDGCTTPSNTTVITSTTSSTTATTLLTFVTNVLFTDANPQVDEIGGALVQWTLPPDESTIDGYEVVIAYDRTGTEQVDLWWQKGSEIGTAFPVGESSANLHENTGRSTDNQDYPANWLLVYSIVGGVRQPLNPASTVRIYDHSIEPPNPVDFSITFTDTDPVDHTIAGTLQWEALGLADFGRSTNYEVMLAYDASGTGKVSLQSVPLGTNELVIPDGTECWDRNYLLVYMSNPNGPASSATSQQLLNCTTPQPTTTTTFTSMTATSVTLTDTSVTSTTVTTVPGATTLTSVTATVTTATTATLTTLSTTVTSFPPTVITDLSFTDSNTEANQIGGAVVTWNPPADESQVTHYNVFLANDPSGSHSAPLVYSDGDEFSSNFPVGTNLFHIFSPTRRQTSDSSHPANWILVYSALSTGGTSEVVRVPLYDNSDLPPGDATLQLDAFDTRFSAGGEIEGTIRWAPASAQEDLGFVESLGIYLAADDSGTGQENVKNISLAWDSFSLPTGYTCEQSGYLGVYLQNPNGQALATSWLHLPPCAPATATSSTTATFTTTVTPSGPPTSTTLSTTTTVEDHRISHLYFEDTNEEPGQIGAGFVQWVPPVQRTGVTHYEAYIAFDSLGTHQAQLWYEVPDTFEIGMEIPVGTNQFYLFHNTVRRTMVLGYPANWLIVYAVSGTTRQDIDDAAKLPLYDHSPSVPVPLFVSSIDFNDTDDADERIAGNLSWQPASNSDFGFATHFEVFLAKNSLGWGTQLFLGNVDVFETELVIREGTYCWDHSYLMVYAANPNGRSTFPASMQMEGCTTPAPTTTNTATTSTVSTSTKTTVTTIPGQPTLTTTTLTSTSTATLDPTRIWQLDLDDTQPEANKIGGAIVEWVPPIHMSGIDHFEVYISYDEIGSHQAQLWWSHPVTEKHGRTFPVGTNRFDIWDPTTRQTHSADHPANWLIVYTSSGGTLQPVNKAAKIPIYDASPDRPGNLNLDLSFSDEDPEDKTIKGTLAWVAPAGTDFGFTKDFAVYLATDATGTSGVLLAEVPAGTHEAVFPEGTHCWDRDYLLVYPRNPNGLTQSPSSIALEGCTTPDPNALPSTTTGTATVTPAPAVADLEWVDLDPAANQIGGGIVSWTPPDDLSEVIGYEVYIAHDELGTHMAQLWYTEFSTGDIYPRLPVGTNEFHVASNTRRQTMSYGVPANWLITMIVGTDGQAQEVASAAKVPLYDESSDLPASIGISTSFSDDDPEADTFGGTLDWAVLANTDLGFMTHFAVFQVNNSIGDDSRLNLQNVSVGTNEFVVPSGTKCSDGDFLVVYASNPNGYAAEPSGYVPDICASTSSGISNPAPTPAPAPQGPLFSFPLVS